MKGNAFFKFVALLIAGLLIITAVLPLLIKDASAASSYDETKNNIANLQNKMNSISKQQKQLQSGIDASKSKIKSENQKKADLDKQINLLADNIDTQNDIIAQYDKQIASLNSQSEDLQKQIDSKFDLYKARVKANFEAGETSFLEVVFGAKDFSDLLVRLDMASSIMKFDKKLINGLVSDKQQILQLKSLAEDSKAKESAQKVQLQQSQNQYQQKKSESDAIIASLNQDVKESQQAYDENEKLEQDFRNQLQKELKSIATIKDYVGGEFTWPAPGYTTITCPFGNRIHPITGKAELHTGVDIGAPYGATVVAANGGKVIKAAYNVAYGNCIVIDHGGGKTTLYAHLSKFLVSNGDTVTKGQEIGKVGTTGFSTGPHLHFEIRENGSCVNPMSYFK
ncbi:MAG: peptidoglycan DD-metalloendopeptidase family protein [Bacillota bacterium]|nr:peptidoglycan DD-metalloendopeptidase family protein [Bacillota bacterium]